MTPPDFGRSVNPISTKRGRLCPPNNTGTPGFSDLPTALRSIAIVPFMAMTVAAQRGRQQYLNSTYANTILCILWMPKDLILFGTLGCTYHSRPRESLM